MRSHEPSERWRAAASVAILLGLWHVGASVIDNRHLPTPWQVGRAIISEAWHGRLAYDLGASLARVLVSLGLAMIVGVLLGYLLGRIRAADMWFRPGIVVWLNLPALVIVILAYIWLGLTEAALILAVAVSKIPNVAVTIREGAAALDRDLAEVGEAYRLPALTRARHIVLPQLAPYLLVALRTCLSLSWKIVLLAELLGRSSGVGFQLQVFFQNFDVARILAYALSFCLVVLAIEYWLIVPLERRLNRWRR